jgi:hypothetical protein
VGRVTHRTDLSDLASTELGKTWAALNRKRRQDSLEVKGENRSCVDLYHTEYEEHQMNCLFQHAGQSRSVNMGKLESQQIAAMSIGHMFWVKAFRS